MNFICGARDGAHGARGTNATHCISNDVFLTIKTLFNGLKLKLLSNCKTTLILIYSCCARSWNVSVDRNRPIFEFSNM